MHGHVICNQALDFLVLVLEVVDDEIAAEAVEQAAYEGLFGKIAAQAQAEVARQQTRYERADQRILQGRLTALEMIE